MDGRLPKKCIVVEDDPFWMSEVVNGLATEEVQIFKAPSATEGLRLLDQHPDAAMVIDIILPDQDGLEVLRDARAKCPDLRVLAISGGGRLGADFYLKLADAFGADAVIEKPFTAEQLVVGWRQALAGKKT